MSASSLAERLAKDASFDHFAKARQRIMELTGRRDWNADQLTQVLRAMATLTGVGSEGPDLLVASSYYEYKLERDPLFNELRTIFRPALAFEPSKTHLLVADTASEYLNKPRSGLPSDYLIITTNYDTLMEDALTRRGVPYYVLSASREGRATRVAFSSSCERYLGIEASLLRQVEDLAGATAPVNYEGPQFRTKSLAVIYRIHGDLGVEKPDNIVISDEDYVNFLSLNGKNGAIPNNVITLLRGKGLLLLGYSFRDWSVRSLHKTMTANRGALPSDVADNAVMTDVFKYETGYFKKKQINILETPLDLFCDRINENRSQ